MDKSDIEEFKSISWTIVGMVAFIFELVPLAIVAWVLAFASMIAGCALAYYEQRIKALKRRLGGW